MISCYELRIGNYVLAQNGLQRIAMINNKASLPSITSIDVEDNPAEKPTQHTFHNIQPVPLNDEILKQCGFVYHAYFKFWQLITGAGHNRSEMDIDRDYNILDFMRKPIVKKVLTLHQLQNVYFMLKGKELDFQPNA
jgi:hypothetical protein